MHSGKLLAPLDLSAVKNAVLKNPKLSHSEFIKNNPRARISSNAFLKYRYAYIKEAGRLDELPLRSGYTAPIDYMNKTSIKPNKAHRKKLYSSGWCYPVKDFDKCPITAFQSFLETLSENGRANLELIKIERHIDGAWVPHYEIRES